MSKRRNEDDDDGSNKRRKQDPTIEIVEKMEQAMNWVNKEFNKLEVLKELTIPGLVYRLPRKLLEDDITAAKLSSDYKWFIKHCSLLRDVVSTEKEKTATDEPEDAMARLSLQSADISLGSLLDLANQLQKALLSKSAPSKYALASVWTIEQAHPQPILCLRPTGKQGLPLTLIHTIFSRFRQLRLQPLPSSPIAAHALRVALRLCGTMGDSFDLESLRSLNFDKCVGNFLPGLKAESNLKGREFTGEPDHITKLNGHCILIRDDKAEMGTGGDAYMQVSRSFDLACEDMESNNLMPNAPVFLLCVIGPTLTIAGGFKDHADTVVEPLCPALHMLEDMDEVNGRAMQLAMHLFALRTCMEELCSLPHPPSLASGLPRIFQSYQDIKGETRKLTVQSRLVEDLLLFAAVDDMSRQLCVKFVYGPYGKEVHGILSDEGMAPKLYGVSRIEDGPTMIVMERLDDSWNTLHDYSQQSSRWTADGVQTTIIKRLKSIVDKLKDHNLVHGDLRTNNIMVKANEEGSAMIVDFDWAGTAGQVHYPLGRNPVGVTWPGEDGSTIYLAHDQEMLSQQWESLPKSGWIINSSYS